MVCDECKKRPAEVHITNVVNGDKYERHLCGECARANHHFALEFQPNLSFNQLLANLLNYDQEISGKNISYRPGQCENCGLTYHQFRQGGKLGCSHCYSVFDKNLESLLRRIHGATVHKGKLPVRTAGKLKVQREIDQLKYELNRLIAKEEFERAAQVRDQIKELEKQYSSEGGE